MAARILHVNLPTIDGWHLYVEECCWNLTPWRGWPAGLWNAAAKCEAAGDTAGYADLGFGEVLDWASWDAAYLRVAWRFIRETLPAIERVAAAMDGRPVTVAVEPAGYADRLLAMLPANCRVVCERTLTPASLIPWRLYEAKPYRYDGITYQVTSGCRYGCRFCTWARMAPVWRDPQLAARELQRLSRRMSPRWRNTGESHTTYLLCPGITDDPAWLPEFTRAKKIYCPGLRYATDLNPLHVGPSNQKHITESRLRSACLGVEALSDAMLARMGKPYRWQHIRRALPLLSRWGVRLRFSLRQGSGETPVEVLSQIERIDELAALGVRARVVVGPLYAWRGTAMARETPAEDLVDRCGGLEIPTRADVGMCKHEWREVLDKVREVGW